PKKCFSTQRSPVNRPFSRHTAYKSNIYAVKGKVGTAVKTSAGCDWRKTTPLSNTNSGPTPDSNVNVSRGPQGRPKPVKAWVQIENNLFLIVQGLSSKLSKKLFQVGSVTFGGSKVVISRLRYVDKERISYGNTTCITFDMKYVDSSKGYNCLLAKASSNEAKLWHRRLGHLNFKNLNKLVKDNLVRGLPSKSFKNDHTCVACQKGKQHKASCKAKIDRYVTHPLHTLHMDLFGPTSVRSINHASYCLVITDDCSRFCWVFFLAKKDETSGILKTFIRQIENQLNQKVKIIRSDNGTEFKNRVMLEFCGEKGIKQEFSNARTPQQNGVAERMNRTLIEAARSMLADSHLPTTFWAEAVNTACYTFNRVRVTKPQHKTPYELLFGHKPILSYIRPFGCHVTILNTLSPLGKSNYDEVFAPVARIEAIRLFLAFASFMGFIVYQMDVKSAFLYGIIDEEVYVSQPPGFVDPDHPTKVYKVVKALYGLHQAPRAWYATLSTFLEKHGYKRGTIDKTLFIRRNKKDIMLVQVYVDDIIFGSTNKSWCDEFEALMQSRFQMSSMGELTFFLGLQVKQNKEGIFISQDKYVAEILKKFDLVNVKAAITPMETKLPLTKDEEAFDVDVHLYRSMIGSLMYLTASRPDIMYAVCVCSRFQVTPKTSHLNAVKRIFKYLKGKPNLGLWYPRESPLDLEAFSDSDYGGSNLDRKSTTGGCQFLGQRLISWQCKKQTIVATSTTEAEYVAAANCCGQVLWVQNQLLDYGFNFMNTKIHIDNESTICIVKNPVYHSKTKHIEIRHHFIRDCYEKKLISVEKIHTDLNVADLLTKPFDGPRFNYLVVSIGFAEIVDFLRGSNLRYALTANPPIYDSLVKQFWQSAITTSTTDGSLEIRATIDTIRYSISEASIRNSLQLDDATQFFAATATARNTCSCWDSQQLMQP
ncbi:uncharacterized protein Tco_0701166, partial [Tanacetum coccineum]